MYSFCAAAPLPPEAMQGRKAVISCSCVSKAMHNCRQLPHTRCNASFCGTAGFGFPKSFILAKAKGNKYNEKYQSEELPLIDLLCELVSQNTYNTADGWATVYVTEAWRSTISARQFHDFDTIYMAAKSIRKTIQISQCWSNA